ncbi:MAG: YaiO family outer membrane beta-barrel protein [Gemmatimonadota bacterium]|nr:YaiO family outer membrane beta-barrel protein [Gemmatimonadota bacterium]
MIVALALATLAVLTDTTPVPAAPRPSWDARLTHTHEWISFTSSDRSETRLRVGRRVGRGSLGMDIVRVRDLRGSGSGVGAEAYLPLWRLGEGFLRVAASSGEISTPELEVGGEVLQHVHPAWSVGAGGWHREYELTTLRLANLVIGHSSGEWDLRARAGVVLTDEETVPIGHIIARRHVGARGSHVEGVVAAGNDVLDFVPDVGGGLDVLATPTFHGALRGRIAVGAAISVLLGGGYSVMREYGERLRLEVGLARDW